MDDDERRSNVKGQSVHTQNPLFLFLSLLLAPYFLPKVAKAKLQKILSIAPEMKRRKTETM